MQQVVDKAQAVVAGVADAKQEVEEAVKEQMLGSVRKEAEQVALLVVAMEMG